MRESLGRRRRSGRGPAPALWLARCTSVACVAFGACVAGPCALAGVRDHTRPKVVNTSTSVSASQAAELTLTLTEAAMRPVQTWIRTAGTLDQSGRVLTAFVEAADGKLAAVGQRVRAFPVTYRTQVREGYVTKVASRAGGVEVQATLDDRKHYDDARYLLEVIVEQGPFLSIPNVSIIEDGDEHVVYVQSAPGRYDRRAIEIGRQGELYTEVRGGLAAGDQVVSIGSFFVDAEHKLKTDTMGGMPGMPGMKMNMSMPNTSESGKAASSVPGMQHGSDASPMPNMNVGSGGSNGPNKEGAGKESAMPGMSGGGQDSRMRRGDRAGDSNGGERQSAQ